MIKSAIIIVPHPDDEINLAGGVFEILHNKGIFTTVVICTNGDYIAKDVKNRFYEAKHTQKIFKYQELLFLGYGDSYPGKHIYDTEINEITTSYYGRSETYCAGDSHEYCYTVSGRHNPYTRESMKKDIRSVVLEKKADLIICVDLDRHLDHRCISLLFDECMGEILKSEEGYRPYVLKGFAYNGVFMGPNDFFDKDVKPTTIELLPNENINQKCFPYDWNNRIRIKNGDNTLTLKFWNNPIFKTLLANKTQSDFYVVGFCALECFPRIANPDSCYFYRNPNNLALYSQIEATSGDVHYLNDYMLARPKFTVSEELSISSIGWSPDDIDKEPTVKISFPRKVSLSKIIVFQNINSTIESLRISLDNGVEEVVKCSHSNVLSLIIPSQPTLHLGITFYSSDKIVVNEIECYESEEVFPWNDVPFEKYEDIDLRRSPLSSFVSKISFKVLIRLILFYSRIKAKLKIK